MFHSNFRIAVFTSSPAASELVKKVTETQVEDVDIELFYQGLEEAVQMARDLEEQGVEVIVSRRGTSMLLRENLKIYRLRYNSKKT